MRNLKKILSLVLAMVMAFSVMATANAFSDDAQIDDTYAEAVEVLSALKVFEGYEDGSFQPGKNITRAEVAAIIYRIVTGDVKDTQVGIYADYNKFDDVKSTAWYAGYVNFCANAEYIKGYGDGNFGPNDNVTGYQALAMILRAIGYDKNGEFTGAGWQVQTAAVGKKLGITDNVTAGTLGTAASREVVAELLFQTILVPQVDYTVAFGYTTYGNDSLGWDTFKLNGSYETRIEYGRPATQWKVGTKELVAIPYEAKYTNNVPVDECDVAAAMGLTKSVTVSEAWIDGANISDVTLLTGTNSTIDPLYSTRGANIIGCQGRQTEIYKLNDGTYSIVEINTYFATVEKVVASVVDKNGHASVPGLWLNVYTSAEAVEMYVADVTGYAEDDTVLVTLDGGVVATIEAVAPTATGSVTAYSNRVCNNTTTIKDSQAIAVGTVTLGTTTYTDADKFFVGYPTVASDVLYNVYFDGMGNVIALIPVGTTTTYAVINAIRWNNPAMGTTVGGYVTANLTLADGSVVTDVTVAKINKKTPVSVDESAGVPASAYVSDVYTMNGEYYGHLVTYVVNADGTYSLNVLGATACPKETEVSYDMSGATITKGKSTIYGESEEKINVAYASDETVFLYYNGSYGYDVYVGYNNAPTITAASVCYLLSNTGRVTLAVVNGNLADTSVFQAYLPTTNVSYIKVIDGVLYNVYNVYKIGSTEATPVFVAQDKAPTEIGFYTVTVDDGIATLKLDYVEGVGVKNAEYAGHDFDITRARTAVVANSVATTVNGAPNKNYSNMIGASYLLVKNGVITAGTYEDLDAMDIISVFYDTEKVQVGALQQEIYTPVYVYINEGSDIVAGDQDTDVEVAPSVSSKVIVNYETGTVTNAKGVVLTSGEAQAAASSYTFVVVTGTTAPNVTTDAGVLALVSSNTDVGAYTYVISGLETGETATVSVNGAVAAK